MNQMLWVACGVLLASLVVLGVIERWERSTVMLQQIHDTESLERKQREHLSRPSRVPDDFTLPTVKRK